MKFLRSLTFPDYLSLVALFFAWVSILAIFAQQSNWAVLIMLGAFIFDLLDGYSARKFGKITTRGREIDSFVDIFTYLIFSALFFYIFLSPNILSGVLVGFGILGFGILRLVRYNNEGILQDGGREYYRGVTVTHMNLLVVICYFLQESFSFWEKEFSFVVMFLSAPLMLSEYKSYKIEAYWKFAVLILVIAAITLLLEYDHSQYILTGRN